jgi:uncharacterized integral membrane protein
MYIYRAAWGMMRPRRGHRRAAIIPPRPEADRALWRYLAWPMIAIVVVLVGIIVIRNGVSVSFVTVFGNVDWHNAGSLIWLAFMVVALTIYRFLPKRPGKHRPGPPGKHRPESQSKWSDRR